MLRTFPKLGIEFANKLPFRRVVPCCGAADDQAYTIFTCADVRTTTEESFRVPPRSAQANGYPDRASDATLLHAEAAKAKARGRGSSTKWMTSYGCMMASWYRTQLIAGLEGPLLGTNRKSSAHPQDDVIYP